MEATFDSKNLAILLEIIKQVSDTENTPELADFWYKKYQQAFQENKILLPKKTFGYLQENQQAKFLLTKPYTPLADLNLQKHLSYNPKNPTPSIDREELQTTIEVSVRFLDAVLEVLKFDSKAKKTVQNYRKIGLGVFDFNQLLDKTGLKTEKAVEELGKLISLNAYEASVSLAEEKGVFGNWDHIREEQINNFSFEYWYHTQTGDLKNSQEIKQISNSKNPEIHKYSLLPRRNYKILNLPKESIWQKWNDRKPAEIKSTIKPNKNKPNTNLEPEDSDLKATTDSQLATTSFFENKNPGKPKFEEGELIRVVKANIPETEKIYQISKVFWPQDLAHSKDRKNLHFLEKFDPSSFYYKILGRDRQVEKFLWQENYMEHVDLEEVLQKLNGDTHRDTSKDTHRDIYKNISDTKEPKKQANTPNQTADQTANQSLNSLIKVHCLILNQHQEILTCPDPVNSNNLLGLPGFELKANQVPESTILENTNIIFEQEFEITKEIGTATTLSTDSKTPYCLHLGFVLGIKDKRFKENFEKNFEKNSDKYKWARLDQTKKFCNYLKIFVDKLSKLESKNLVQTTKTHYQYSKNSLSTPFRLFENPVPFEKNNFDNFNKQQKIILQNQKSEISLKGSVENNSVLQSQKNTKNMSKYLLQLLQTVKTNNFGDVTVKIEYDRTGPKIISVDSKNIPPDLKQTLNTFLGLINFTLVKAISPRETATALQKISRESQEMPINKLLMIVGKVMEEVPGNVNQISGDILGEIGDTKTQNNVFESKRPQKPAPQPAPSQNSNSNSQTARPEPQKPAPQPAPSQNSNPQRSGTPFNPFSR